MDGSRLSRILRGATGPHPCGLRERRAHEQEGPTMEPDERLLGAMAPPTATRPERKEARLLLPAAA